MRTHLFVYTTAKDVLNCFRLLAIRGLVKESDEFLLFLHFKIRKAWRNLSHFKIYTFLDMVLIHFRGKLFKSLLLSNNIIFPK